MRRDTLTKAVADCKDTTRIALQTLFDALNKGQQKKILKDAEVKELFDLYGVEYEEG